MSNKFIEDLLMQYKCWEITLEEYNKKSKDSILEHHYKDKLTRAVNLSFDKDDLKIWVIMKYKSKL